jgi:hypothetical protein
VRSLCREGIGFLVATATPPGDNAAVRRAQHGPKVGAYPTVDKSRDRLHRAGWSVGEFATASAWWVSGANGENALNARGRTQAEACWRAYPSVSLFATEQEADKFVRGQLDAAKAQAPKLPRR